MLSQSQWISMLPRPDRKGAPLFRREFMFDTSITSAVLNICGLGYYEAWINQHRVGDHVLDPAQTDYEERVFYVSYDITRLIHADNNCIGVMLGNGWYSQDRVWGKGKGLSYGPPKLLLALNVTLSDGRTVIVSSDESWTCAPGPVIDNNIYAGEWYDASLEQTGWSLPGFDDASWEPVSITSGPAGKLEQQTIPPIRKIEKLTPVKIDSIAPNCYVVDIGQNISGWAHIKVEAPAGTAIQMRFAETIAEDGSIDTASTGVFATGVEQIDSYTCKGTGLEQWEPRFTYHGFRYIEVSGWPGELRYEDITGVVVHTDLTEAGFFACSDARLNQLHRMALWTHRSNIHGLPEDCPARERCGWLGDANLVAEYSMWNYTAKSFWEKYLGDIETARTINDGIPTDIAPGKRGARRDGNPDWVASFIMLPWYLYQFYGDSAVLKQYWDGMTHLMDHFAILSDDWIIASGYGDYFDPGTDSIVSHTPVALTSSLWFYRCADVMCSAAMTLGVPDAANKYGGWRAQISGAITNRFFERESGSFGSQGANVLALAFGIFPGGEERILKALVHDILERDTHLNVGVMGVRYIFEELTKRGHGELALAILHQNSYPSFGHLIERGATTLWECWGEKQHNDTHGPRSLNHPFMGGYDNWFYNVLAGIQPDPANPGFRHFFLAPYTIPGLDWVNAHHDSPYGRIVSSWKLCNGVFEWKITIPEKTNATVRLPLSGCSKKLGPGTYEFIDKK